MLYETYPSCLRFAKDFGVLFQQASSVACNGPIGSRPEPGARRIAPILLLPPGEVPERAARKPVGDLSANRGSELTAPAGTGRYKEKLDSPASHQEMPH